MASGRFKNRATLRVAALGSVYSLASGSQAQFTRDTVRGYGREGKVTGASAVHVAGGEWVPAR